MTQLPTSLRIGHARYTVTADLTRCADEDSEGLSSGNSLEIMIRGDRPHDSNADTLLHEVIHQCIYQAGLDCTRLGRGDLVGREVEEALVRAMTGTLLAALRDNPDLTAYLLATRG